MQKWGHLSLKDNHCIMPNFCFKQLDFYIYHGFWLLHYCILKIDTQLLEREPIKEIKCSLFFCIHNSSHTPCTSYVLSNFSSIMHGHRCSSKTCVICRGWHALFPCPRYTCEGSSAPATGLSFYQPVTYFKEDVVQVLGHNHRTVLLS